ncbi:MAG: glycosyltransferase, partial [Deltaproteobacteria bacterium]|nr:glycosyltransferase [Deltaproteobacteria bacterium]
MDNTKVSIIIPAYNEDKIIRDIIQKTMDLYPDSEIIVINDGSTDDTAIAAREAGAIVYS